MSDERDSERNQRSRQIILERRARFIALALAAVQTGSACGGETDSASEGSAGHGGVSAGGTNTGGTNTGGAPMACLSLPLAGSGGFAGSGGTGPQVCLSAGDGGVGPEPCLSAPLGGAAGSAGEAGAGGAAGSGGDGGMGGMGGG